MITSREWQTVDSDLNWAGTDNLYLRVRSYRKGKVFVLPWKDKRAKAVYRAVVRARPVRRMANEE